MKELTTPEVQSGNGQREFVTRKAVDQLEGFLANVDQTVDQDQEVDNSEVLKATNNADF